MARPRTYSVAAGAVAVIVALSVLLASVRGPAVTPGPPAQNATARGPGVPGGQRETPPEPIRKPGVRVTAPKRLQPPDMPAGPGLPEWSQPITD
jgi:hypothetical protein